MPGLTDRARLAVAERDVVVLVHRDRCHPAVGGVGIERARLEDGRRGGGVAGVSELDPFDRAVAGRARAAGGRCADDQRFLHRAAAEVAIGQPVHEVERDVVEIVRADGRRRLRNAVAVVLRDGVVDARRRDDADRRDRGRRSA